MDCVIIFSSFCVLIDWANLADGYDGFTVDVVGFIKRWRSYIYLQGGRERYAVKYDEV